MQPHMKKRFLERISKPEAFPLLAFVIPLVIRFIPEIIMGPYMVGFDTLGYYVPNTLMWLRAGVGFWSFVAVAPFFYVLLMGVTTVGVPIVISLKVMAPLVLGFLGLTVYFYAHKTLSWSTRKSLLVTLFATLYFVALRISWDMIRSELALIFLFTTLIFLRKNGNPLKNGVLLSLAMLSVVFAHQLVAVIMFAIVLVTSMRLGFDRQMSDVRRLLICSVPAGFLFLLVIYANLVSPSFSVVSGFPAYGSEGWMTLFGFASYADLVVDTLGFLVFCYLPLLPFVLLGVRRFRSNLQLKTWISWVFIAVLLASINPFVVALPYRWILLLTYPFAFYAAEGFIGLRLNKYKVGVGLILAALSVSFVALPSNVAFPYYALFPLYVPVSMLQNTVPLSDCQDTVNALQWVKSNMGDDGRLLVHRVFFGWGSLALNGDQLIHYGYENPVTVVKTLRRNGLEYPLYLVWWVNGSGLHGQPTVSSMFRQVYESGEIAVFTYAPTFNGTSVSEYSKSIKS